MEADVLLLVSVSVSLLCEAQPAALTAEGPFSGMHALMVAYVTQFTELGVANRAAEDLI